MTGETPEVRSDKREPKMEAMHYAAVEKLGLKWSTFATYFSTDFHTKSAKFLTELSQDPNNLKKIRNG